MGTKELGDIAEAVVLARLLQAGHKVLIPFGENHRYDLVVDQDGKFIRLQVKSGRIVGGCVRFKVRSTTTNYSESYHNDVEFIAVYCRDNDKVYLIPVAHTPLKAGEMSIRIDKPKLRDVRIRYAIDYELNGTMAEW